MPAFGIDGKLAVLGAVMVRDIHAGQNLYPGDKLGQSGQREEKTFHGACRQCGSVLSACLPGMEMDIRSPGFYRFIDDKR